MLPTAELKELADDIKANGLLYPIALFREQVLDGRNRLVACGMAGVQPRFEYVSPASPTQFVIASNLKRRQLTPSQKAMIAAEALPLFEAEAKERLKTSTGGAAPRPTQKVAEAAKGEAREKAAKSVGVNRQYVSDAKKIKAEAPAVAAQVSSGEKTISQAKQELFGERYEQGKSSLTVPPKHAPEDDESDVLWNLKRLWRKATKKEKSAFLKWAKK